VSIIGKEDKREITLLLTVTASGKLLPPQVIYQGKNTRVPCTFLESWDITHSDSHWSTKATMLQFIDDVLVPYVAKTRHELD
jgi:hypothetical protein